MATEWVGFLNVITTDKVIGNALAGLIDPDHGGAETFDKGSELVETGGDGSVVAWAAQSPLKQSGLDYCAEFTSDGPYPQLTALGLTAEQIAAAKAAMTLEYGLRANYEGRLQEFIAANGYEIIPQG